MKVFGIDIIKGSVRSKTIQPKYALIITVDGKIVEETSVSVRRLFSLLYKHRPDILAVDSIQEVAHHTQDLYRFLEGMPPKTRFVSVTGGEKKIGLIEAAKRYNITFDKLSPFAEARAIAIVASNGFGVEVVAFEKETEIIVSRNRSPGKGGWSQNRYARKIHGNVRLHAGNIDSILKNAGLEYKKREQRAFGGVSRVIFHVMATRDEIPVSTSRGGDVQIKISGKRLDRLKFVPLDSQPPYLIVGIDPGTTVGLAALTLDGKPVRVYSSRQMRMADVIEFLYTLGKPLIIATDVSVMPFSVEKIRRAFQAVPFVPKQDISVQTKFELAGSIGYNNDHERDSLSAALEAYRYWNHKWTTILRRVPSGIDIYEVKAGIAKGHSLDTILSKKQINSGEKLGKPEVTIQAGDERLRVLEGTLKDLRVIIADLQTENANLKSVIKSRNNQIKSLKGNLKAGISKEPDILKRDNIIDNLKKRLRLEEKNNKKMNRRLKRLSENKAEEGADLIPIRVIPSLSKENIRIVLEKTGSFKDLPVFVMSPAEWGKSSLTYFKESGADSLIIGGKNTTINESLKNTLFSLKIPYSFEADVPVKVRGETGTCNKDDLADALSEWEIYYRNYQKQEKEAMLDGLMKEYIAERIKEKKA